MSDAFTEEFDATDTKQSAESLLSEAAPAVARHARSGNLAVASGVVSLVRAGRTLLKGERKRGLLQAAAGLFWVGVALAQRRTRGGRSDSAASEVVDTAPDIEEAAEPGERETDHATGEEVVDTTDAEIESSDTAPEVETGDVGDETVDQSDVVETGDVEDVEGSAEGSEAATNAEPESGTRQSDGTATDEGTNQTDEGTNQTGEETDQTDDAHTSAE